MTEAKALGQMLRTVKGKKPAALTDAPKPGYVPYIDISALEHGTKRQWADPRQAKVVPAGTLVMVWDGARSGWVAETQFEGALGSTLAALDSALDQRFLAAFLRAHFSDINANHRGSGIPHVNPDYLKALVVPALDEGGQVALAALADEVLAKYEATSSHVAAARRAFSRLRQSVLSMAGSGRLTADWRESHDTDDELASLRALLSLEREETVTGRAAVERAPFGLERLPELPKTWAWVAADAVSSLITKGTTPSADLMVRDEGDVPFLKVYNLTFTGAIDFSVNPTYVSRATHEGLLRRSRVYPGDVLMNIVGPPLGKVALVPPVHPEWNVNQAIAVFRPLPSMSPDFLALCLRAPIIVDITTSRAKATAGQYNLTLEICREVAIPLPPPSEQTEIIRRVHELMTLIDALDGQAAAATRKLRRLPQTVFLTAFREDGAVSSNAVG